MSTQHKVGIFKNSVGSKSKGSSKQSMNLHTDVIHSQNGSVSKFMSNSTSLKSKTLKKSIRLSDLMAAMYPGVKIGHKYCVERPLLVPKTMGWLWNTSDTITGTPFPRGWRPGAIALGVRRKKILRSHSMIDTSRSTIGKKGKKTLKKKRDFSSSSYDDFEEESISSLKVTAPPTLFIQKKGNTYQVVMQPIKDVIDYESESNEQPVQFKIDDDAISSDMANSKSTSSSLKIEYMCAGALRKPLPEPVLVEIGTQWDEMDLTKSEKAKVQESKTSRSSKKVKKNKKSQSQLSEEKTMLNSTAQL